MEKGPKRKSFVAVHVGAGYHSVMKEAQFKLACSNACEAGMKVLREGGDPMQACVEAVKVLEDDPVTNAGTGSSLNREGFVECDAALMDGRSRLFGAVGALPSVKNPIEVSRCLLVAQKQCKGPLVPPMLLAGEGAYKYAKEAGLTVFPLEDEPFHGPLVTKDAIERYHEHMNRCRSGDLNDTVGAVVVDGNGNFVAGVSSGGISLKVPGRIGDTPVFGAGCWAQNRRDGKAGFACSATGTGEQLMRSLFSYNLANAVCNLGASDISDPLSDQLYSFIDQTEAEEKAAGFISIYEGECGVEFWFGHTTRSLGVGYMSEDSERPTCYISRKDPLSPFRLMGSPIR